MLNLFNKKLTIDSTDPSPVTLDKLDKFGFVNALFIIIVNSIILSAVLFGVWFIGNLLSFGIPLALYLTISFIYTVALIYKISYSLARERLIGMITMSVLDGAKADEFLNQIVVKKNAVDFVRMIREESED